MKTRSCNRQRAGFTLLEMMIAVVVLAFGLLAMGMMQIAALQEGSKGHHTSTALAIARDNYEQMLRMPFSSADLAVTPFINPSWINDAPLQPGEVAAEVTAGDGSQTNEQIYRVWYRITADTGIAPDPPNADLRNVDIEVRWDEVNGRSNKKITFSSVIVDNDR